MALLCMVLYAPHIKKCIFGNGGRAALLLARFERITFMGRYVELGGSWNSEVNNGIQARQGSV